MAQRTRLFQKAGSPLIQGYSRTERPNWQPWLSTIALLWGLCAAWLAWRALASDTPALDYESGVLAAYALGTGVGSLIGIVLGRSWGVRRKWPVGLAWGAVTGVACAFLVRRFV